MTKNNILSFFSILTLFCSCSNRELTISAEDINNKENIINIEVFGIHGLDTVVLEEIRQGQYRVKNYKSFIISFSSKEFEIKNIDRSIKSIYFKYLSEADHDCYAIHTLNGDTIQSDRLDVITNCSSITNVYLSSDYQIDTSIESKVRIRRKESP